MSKANPNIREDARGAFLFDPDGDAFLESHLAADFKSEFPGQYALRYSFRADRKNFASFLTKWGGPGCVAKNPIMSVCISRMINGKLQDVESLKEQWKNAASLLKAKAPGNDPALWES